MLKFLKQFKGESEKFEVTHDEALDTLLTTYKDNDITRDMLKFPNEIPCVFSYIYVIDID